MTSDETHQDFADMDTTDFVCTNRGCDHYRKPIDVPVVTGTLEVLDSRDLDCECGAQLVQIDLVQGVEEVEHETIRRYREVGV